MAGRRVDRTGVRYFKLTFVKYLRTDRRYAIWLCKCDCGKKKEWSSDNKPKCCGCSKQARRVRTTFINRIPQITSIAREEYLCGNEEWGELDDIVF